MNLTDPGYLMSSLLISCAGMGFFMYGRRASRLWPLSAGLVLCIYPYFVSSLWLMWGIAAAIVVAVYLLREQ